MYLEDMEGPGPNSTHYHHLLEGHGRKCKINLVQSRGTIYTLRETFNIYGSSRLSLLPSDIGNIARTNVEAFKRKLDQSGCSSCRPTMSFFLNRYLTRKFYQRLGE